MISKLYKYIPIVGMLLICCIINSVYGQSGQLNGHDYVDLGLSVKWATMNVGSSNPKDFGDYFAWGDTALEKVFNDSTYSYSNCIGKDIAATMWGGGWRTPTKAEFEELINKCKWIWTSNGYRVIGSNGNNIFLPAAGFRYDHVSESDKKLNKDEKPISSVRSSGAEGNYWSKSLYSNYPVEAWRLYFKPVSYVMYRYDRKCKFSIRPVCVSNN